MVKLKLTTPIFLSIVHLLLLFRLQAEQIESPPALFSIGGGTLYSGFKYLDGVVQAEYKGGIYLWRRLRPQAILFISQSGSFYAGLGMGWEFYLTDRIVLTPSFGPGFYAKGGGRNLGFPLEFRSAIELSYEFENSVRIGAQLYHLSNAHLSHRNPGCNAITVFTAFPFDLLRKEKY